MVNYTAFGSFTTNPRPDPNHCAANQWRSTRQIRLQRRRGHQALARDSRGRRHQYIFFVFHEGKVQEQKAQIEQAATPGTPLFLAQRLLGGPEIRSGLRNRE